ncbi:TonB-dependent receptor plug domain-containing protein [Pelagicoccus mobilis]|uniref:TonB-dependent receptor plug domain-containing protein n=1 Tax=Pelagicoccus mobilis TaxID=415221 RepID=UPI00366D0C0A
MSFAQQDDEDEEIFELSPFTVEGTENQGYRATSTLAGTRIRTDLKDVGSAISVITAEFLEDTNSKTTEDLLVYTTGTEVAGQGGNFAGQGDGAILNDGSHVEPVSNTRVRGLAGADNLRDFFLSDIPWDSYNVNRVDLQRGANSVLFGIGSPAGIINSSINSANFENSNKIGVEFGSFGSFRSTLDVNRVLIEDKLSVRFSALYDDKQYRQDPAFREDQRAFVALRWEPELFAADGAHTEIRANFETGDIDGINPRLSPPMDAITPWFESMDQLTVPWLNSNLLTNKAEDEYNPYLGAAGNRIWDGNVVAFNSADATSQSFAFAASGKNYPEGGTNNPFNGSYKGIVSYNNIAKNLDLPGSVVSPYKSKSLTDASVFDFYNNLIEGENRRNSSSFDAYNVNLSQTFFDNQLGFEVVFDEQDVDWSWKHFLAWDAATISVDVMETLIDGSPNPNVGRPMLIGGGGSAGSGRVDRERSTQRFTAFANYDFRDKLDSDSMLARVLGRHSFTANYTTQEITELRRGWNNWFVGSGYGPTSDVAVGQAGRDATTITYLGPDLRGSSTYKGLNLSRLTAIQEAASDRIMQWDSTSASVIQYDLPIVNPNSSSYNDANRPYTQASKFIDKIDSEVLVWQGFMFGGNVVPMAGWRRDTDLNRSAGAPNKVGGLITNYADPDWVYATDPASDFYNEVEGQTRTYSIVVHMPESITEQLPWGMTLSAFYNESANFQPNASRRDILGNAIPSPTGETEDYGINISALEGKLYLKINKYKTLVNNATLSDELGNAYLIGAGEAWGQAAAYHLGQDDGIWPGNGDYGTTSEGSAFGAGHTLRWEPSYDYLVNDSEGREPWSDGYENTFSQAGIDEQYDIQRRSTEDWLSKPVPDAFQNAWGMSGYNMGTGEWSMNSVAVTGDTLSEGTEFELVFNPTENLNIALNGSKTKAQRLNLGRAYSEWIEKRYQDYLGPMGDMRLWGPGNWALQTGAGGTVRDKFNNETYPAYLLALALNGTDVPELRPWRFNLVANYDFSDGVMKGSNVGMGYRWQDENVTGFGLNSTLDGYDANKRYYGPTEDSFDFWIGRSQKILNDSVDWRIQLNIRNAFGDKKLIPVTVQPDGTPAAYRIAEPTTFTVSNTFEF